MADMGTDFNGLPSAGTLEGTDVVPLQRGTGGDSTLRTTIAQILSMAGSGAQTGDFLLTARTPEGDWLKQDAIYMQADYPELFGMVGLLGDGPPGRLWEAATIAGFSGVANDGVQIDEDTSVIVGVNAIWRSADRCKTWVKQTTAWTLNRVICEGGGILYAVGNNGVVVKSMNRGVDWVLIGTVSAAGNLRAIVVFDSSTIVVCGASSAYRTTNGGGAWGAIAGPTSTVTFIRFSPSIAVAFLGNNSTAYRTTDAGANWPTITLPAQSMTNSYRGFYDAGSNRAIIPANNGALFTNDMAQSFVVSPLGGGYANIIGVNGRVVAFPTSAANPIKFSDDMMSWTPGATQTTPMTVQIPQGDTIFAMNSSGSFTRKSNPEYNYDTATMFKTPSAGDVRGYIKP